ncbi:hypothetical protein ACFL47_06345 [Candidatus Latescibacterota bacterium]
MDQVPEKIKKDVDQFASDIRDTFGNAALSVILYGPASRGEHYKDRTYINFLVILEDNTPSELAKCSGRVKSWLKRRIATPLFLDPSYIGRSLDTFPLEFMDMKAAYVVIHGDDVLGDLSFNADDIRNQCERELKGKLLYLRAEYLTVRSNKKLLVDLINRSLNTFRLVFAGALHLTGCDIPKDTATMLETVAEEYSLDGALLKQLAGIGNGEIKVSETEADRIFDLYVEELDKLSHKIDVITDITPPVEPHETEEGDQEE